MTTYQQTARAVVDSRTFVNVDLQFISVDFVKSSDYQFNYRKL